MAADSSSKETVAVVFLAEASLTVGQEFCKKLTDYSTALIKRLHDNHLQAQFKIAFVSYGAADTAPSPILCKRFFSDRPAFFKEMMEDVSHFGVGLINSGRGKGMAALDGFAATLELFDILQSFSVPREGPNSPPIISHIIHVAASSPDSSLHPLCNDNAALDNIDWDSLPQELKKRNINYTTINLVSGLSRFQDLYSAVVTGGSAPWFTVYNPHVVLLAPFPPALQTKATPTKRANEQPVERAAESKRPRLQPNTESPKPAPKAATPSAQPIAPVASHTQPIRPAPAHHKGPAFTPHTFAQMSEKLKIGAAEVSGLYARVTAAKAAGDMKLAEELNKEMREKMEMHGKFHLAAKGIIGGLQGQIPPAAIAQLQAQAQVFHKLLRDITQVPFGVNAAGNSLSPDNNHPTPSNMPMPPGVPNPPQMQHARSFSDTNFPMNPAAIPSPPNNIPQQNGSNAITAQMYKMLEQNRARQQQQQQQAQAQAQAQQQLQSQQLQPPPVEGPPNPMLSGNPMHNIAPSTAMPNRLTMPPNMAMAPGGQMLGGDAQQRLPVWQGPMHWSGIGAMGKKAMHTLVAAFFIQGNDCHENTWPVEMVLAPTKENLVSEAELTAWMNRNKPAMCHILPQTNVPDPERNNTSFKQLLGLLTERKIYATVAWTTPSGGQTRNALLIPMNGNRIVGAFFALTGLPELPKPMSALLNELSVPPAVLAQMQSWPIERQVTFVSQIRDRGRMMLQQQQQQRQQQQQQQQQQLPPSNNPGFTPNMVSNQNLMAAMLAAQRTGGPPMNMNAPQPSIPASLPRFGMGNQNNFSEEIMQSFVQRTGDGGNNMNLQG